MLVEAKPEPETMLRTDAALEVFVRLASPTYAAPVCRSPRRPRFAVLALGGQLSTGPLSHLPGRRPQGLRGVDSS